MKENRNGFVDLIRFLGSLSIMAGHWYSVWPQVISGEVIRDGFFKFFGIRLSAFVALFFVISGYYTAKSFSSLSEGRVHCGDWIFGRVRRLLPPYILSLVFFSVLDILYWTGTGDWWLGRKWTLSKFLLTMLGINNFETASGNPVNSPAWFVGVLLLNSMIFALAASSKMRREAKAACFLAVFFLGLSFMELDSAIPLVSEKVSRGYMSFFAGVLFGLYLKPKKDAASIPWIEILVLAATAGISCGTGCLSTSGLAGDRIILYTFLIGPALIRIGENAFIQKVFTNRITALAGGISYDIYLFHMPVFVWIAFLFGNTVRYESRPAFLAAALAVSVLSSVLYGLTPILETVFLKTLRSIGFGR